MQHARDLRPSSPAAATVARNRLVILRLRMKMMRRNASVSASGQERISTEMLYVNALLSSQLRHCACTLILQCKRVCKRPGTNLSGAAVRQCYAEFVVGSDEPPADFVEFDLSETERVLQDASSRL